MIGFGERRKPSSLVFALLLLVGTARLAPAGEGSKDARFSQDPADRIACEANLNLIFEAIQEYRKQHENRLPDKLSDLLTDFIADRNVLTCPFVQKSGGLQWWKEIRDLSLDPLTSYGYEFTSNQIPDHLWRGWPRKSEREFKERQMGRLGATHGPSVPVVRCFAHGPWEPGPHLNLAFDGQIYTSGLYWESNFTNVAAQEELEPARIFADRLAARSVQPKDLPPRNPAADNRLIDLTANYNALLSDSWQGFTNNNLASLPSGLQKFGAVSFDVRGVIQLRAKEFPVEFPERVEGIKVNQKASRIHFLHGTTFRAPPQTRIASYLVHYSDGQVREIPVIYGKEISDCWFDPGHPSEPSDASIAWTGHSEAADAYLKSIRLYHAQWENPSKDLEIVSVSFASSVTFSAPFLIAMTVEP